MLQKRGSIYYFRWAIPKPYRSLLGRTEITRSLKTSCRSLAAERAARYHWLIRSLKSLFTVMGDNLIGQQDAPDDLPKGYQEFIQKLMDAVVGTNAVWSDKHPDYEHYQKSYQKSLTLRELIRQASLSEKGDLPDRNMTIYEMMVEHFKLEIMDAINWHFPIDDIIASEDGERFKRDLLIIYNEANETYLENFHPDKVKPEPPSYLKNNFRSSPSRGTVTTPPAPHQNQLGLPEKSVSASSMLFSVMHEEFIQHKTTRGGGLTTDVLGKYTRYYEMWIEIVGDIPIDTITKAMVRNFLLDCCRLPKRSMKPYNAMALSDLVGVDIPEQDLVSKKTVNNIKKWLHSVFRFCLDQEILKASPAVDLNMRELTAATKSYAYFNDIEMRKILSGNDAIDDQKAWIVRIAAYSGMRLGEILGLKGAAIKRDEETGRYYFHVTDKYGARVKTEAGIRFVPIHQAILDAGFIDQFGHVIGDMDAPVFSYSISYISNWFVNKVLNSLEIDPESATGNRKVFHSFRHTVVTKLRSSGFSDHLIKQVVGHEIGARGVTDRYDHGASVAQLLPLIDAIKY